MDEEWVEVGYEREGRWFACLVAPRPYAEVLVREGQFVVRVGAGPAAPEWVLREPLTMRPMPGGPAAARPARSVGPASLAASQ